MIASPRLSPSSSSSSSNVNLSGDNIFPRSVYLQPVPAARVSRISPRASASCASATEKERTNGSRLNQNSFGSGSGERTMVAETLYDVLEVAAGASPEEIKAAYRKLARSCHPDVVKPEDRRSAAATAFMRIHAAYATLSDPEKRAEYDLRRPSSWKSPSSPTRYSPRYPGSPSPTSGYRRRTWETDQCW